MSTEITKDVYDSILSRLAALVGSIEQKKIAAAIGLDGQHLATLKARRILPADKIELYCLKNGVNYQWILTGEGDLRGSATTIHMQAPESGEDLERLAYETAVAAGDTSPQAIARWLKVMRENEAKPQPSLKSASGD